MGYNEGKRKNILQSSSSRNDLNELLSDDGLAGSVEGQSQLVNHLSWWRKTRCKWELLTLVLNHTLARNIGHWSSKASETERKMTHKRSCWRCPSRSSWRSAHWWWTPSSHSRWCWPEQTPDSSSAHQHRCHHRRPCFLNKTHDRFFILKPSKYSQIEHNNKDMHEIRLYIYIYAFSRRFYPKQAIYILVSTCVPSESNPQPFALLTQCSNHWATQEHYLYW